MRRTSVGVDVTAVGLLSSVGHDALTACAAIRAGISRPAAIAGTSSYDLIAAKSVELVGHPIEPITNGFSGTARWLQMAPLAFEDLIHNGGLPGPEDEPFWTSTAVMVMVPDLEHPRFDLDDRSDPGRVHETFVRPLLRRLPVALLARNILLRAVDRIGLALVVDGFDRLLAELKVDRIVALGVDSYVCPFALEWLGEGGRLKGDLNPVGLTPGEAAAALLLEPGYRQTRRERPPWACIVEVTTAQDAPFDDRGAGLRGRMLAEVLAPLLTGDTRDVYLDLNGEEWRAKEYGNALSRLGPSGLGSARAHHAAVSVGDVGASSFVLNTALAARSLQRGYSHGRQVAVTSSAETGEVGGLALRWAGGN